MPPIRGGSRIGARPAPEKVLRSKLTFDLIWLSAVWMHVPPSAPTVNRSKGDRLPAAEALERSRSCILEWWDLAYRRDIVLRTQYDHRPFTTLRDRRCL